MQLILHLGAHKTATTYLQAHWGACSRACRRSGLFAPPLAELRRHLTPAAKPAKDDAALQAAAAYMKGLADAHRQLLVSDENLLGSSQGNFKGGALYPRALERLSRLKQALPSTRPTVLFCVRGYAAYLASSYCEVLRHARFEPFKAMHAGLDIHQRGWPEVIRDIVAAFSGARVIVWCHEDMAAIAPALTSWLFDTPAAQLPTPPSTRFRARFSQPAIEVATMLHGAIGPALTPEVFAGLTKLLPAEDHAVFDPWSAEERRVLDAAYASALAAIDRMPEVEFWRPGSPVAPQEGGVNE